MPKPTELPSMGALTGTELLIGSQGGVTGTTTGQALADFVATNAVAGVASVNGKVGEVSLVAADVSADPAGAAAAAETAARNHAATLVNDHAAEANPHNLTKATIGLGSVDNTADADKPVSTAVQAELNTLNNALGTKIPEAPADGLDYVRRDKTWVQAGTGGTNGAKTLIKTESEYAALTPEAGVVYVIVADPPPSNLLHNGDFALADSGWTQYAGTNATFTGGVLGIVSTANHTVGQANAAMEGQPASGATLNLSFDVVTYTEGTINPRVRYTDGTVFNFYGGETATGIAGAEAAPGTKTASLTLDPAKTFDRFEFRVTIRNGSIDLSLDNVSLTVA
jgi:hypothetical protein